MKSEFTLRLCVYVTMKHGFELLDTNISFPFVVIFSLYTIRNVWLLFLIEFRREMKRNACLYCPNKARQQKSHFFSIFEIRLATSFIWLLHLALVFSVPRASNGNNEASKWDENGMVLAAEYQSVCFWVWVGFFPSFPNYYLINNNVHGKRN